MNTLPVSAVVATCLVLAVLLGTRLRRLLPEHHLAADSKDAVKLAIGLIATMTALLLGLLVSSAKGSFDTERTEVVQMAAKVAFLDRLLTLYGPEAADARTRLHALVEEAVRRMWPEEAGAVAQLQPDEQAGDATYAALQSLSPRDDTQRAVKAQAMALAVEFGQLRMLLVAQAIPSISPPLLVVVVSWLVIIFLVFSLLAPPNATTALCLVAAALSVSGAIFLVLELDHPFGGMIRIPSAPMLAVVGRLAK
ncbi:MAG TPA: hypothetical protein VMS22_26330 [Candidatus Eisenbacteria bacterium]|nr:hypothetical protein [Candidatus Eisenbacteria bacterium]